ncbi:sensor histidine kinase [Hoeflea sp. TYP-13]|uniref:sensor histidine kinase n=1 Tax=Hoeflea sp. TYP-13 TaxID=3230023 RepID=UPI0034C5E6A2
MRRGFSLRRRLTFSMLLVFFLGLGASATYFYFDVRSTQENLRERTLQGQARDLLQGMHLNQARKIELFERPEWLEAYSDANTDYAYTLYDGSGLPVTSSVNLKTPLPFLELSDQDQYGTVQFTGIGASQRALLAARAPASHILIVARTRADPSLLAESVLLEEDYQQFLVFLPFVMVSILVMWLISSRSLQPLRRASGEAALAGPSNPSARIGTAGLPGEVLPLVEAVNKALDRLAQAYLAEQRLTANVAHELRTPLSVLSLHLQRYRNGDAEWQEIERDVAHLTRIVGQVLNLARKEDASRSPNSDLRSVNFARVVREAAAQVLPLVDAAGRTLDVIAPKIVAVHGQGDDLRDLVVNLLDNALTHGQGTICLTLSPGSGADGSGATLEVHDEGEGIPEKLREEVFNRFRKGTPNSPGAGLGLTIVRQIARNRGGEARVLPGSGSTVHVILPTLKSDESFPGSPPRDDG